MEKQSITPVQVIQELIAMLGTRKEACERILAKPDAASSAGGIKNVSGQTEKYITELQSELSDFGDGVSGDVDRNNAYQAMWKRALENEASSSAGELKEHFMQMESTLKKSYIDYIDTERNLPERLLALLKQQLEGLNRHHG